MENKALYEALPFLEHVDQERQAEFEEYFKGAPDWVLESFHIKEMDKGSILLREGEPTDFVYFIGKGILEAVDYRVHGNAYEFQWFDKLYAMGGMEYLMDEEVYRTTLRTVTKCIIVCLPMSVFKKWMKMDIRALKHESKLVGTYLLEQGRMSRAFIFLQGSDRLAMLFVHRYKRYAVNDVFVVDSSYQDLSNATGLCTKTICRSMKKFIQNDLITKEKSKVYITKAQYKKLKEIVAQILESDE